MNPSESNVMTIPSNDIRVKKVKKMLYRGLEIYAVKRAIINSSINVESNYWYNTEWWCGYVEVPLDMYGLLKPEGYLDEEILYRLADPDSYDLAVVHGGYTYLDYGIPHVLDCNQRIFLGWDYNHFCDTESCVTYDEIIDVGKRVVDSMLDNRIEKENR